MLNYKNMLKYTIIRIYGFKKNQRNYTIMLNFTLSKMCVNKLKYNTKYTNTLCRITLLYFSKILSFRVFVEVCDLCLLTSYSVCTLLNRGIIKLR